MLQRNSYRLFFPLVSCLLCAACATTKTGSENHGGKKTPVIVWQPSHQTNTGVNFSEAATCHAIVEAAMATGPKLKEYKVWSLGVPNLHHADVGSNTVAEHTSAVIGGQLSGYAYELQESNKKKPQVFIAVHNNGGTKRHAVWGYIHYGDAFEQENRVLAGRLIAAIARTTGLENRGVLLDSTTGRNDYRCASTGKLAFYSLDEHINTARHRVLLEIGDNSVSYDFLQDSAKRKLLGEAIKKELAAWLTDTYKE
ncbi:N-acetylmuramoyl-L-alanine amidase [Sediminibacterium soli]|uniref:N-acetylmuramoyl-L-alanine amidase n=1 Tax=Sediminibacterium soli TaxID=2698829 RepID=UPI00137AAE9F|nr:N-acetylmuramoyl-L-alanine amidase [Sediminibacterium soli]NCI46846.1 hypothetical protein [Sediminibacterium soli]